MSIDSMSHEQATSSQAAERYALGRLAPEEREAFEGHYFDCPDCFEQVRLEMHFRRHAKEVLGPEAERERGWAARMLADMWRPAPVFATALLFCCFVGINLYQLSEIADLKSPRIQMRPTMLTAQAKGGTGKQVVVKRDSSVPLSLEFNRRPEFTSYQAEIVSVSSRRASRAVPVPADAEEGSVTVSIPADSLEPGSYYMDVYGMTKDGRQRVNRGRFELEFQD